MLGLRLKGVVVLAQTVAVAVVRQDEWGARELLPQYYCGALRLQQGSDVLLEHVAMLPPQET